MSPPSVRCEAAWDALLFIVTYKLQSCSARAASCSSSALSAGVGRSWTVARSARRRRISRGRGSGSKTQDDIGADKASRAKCGGDVLRPVGADATGGRARAVVRLSPAGFGAIRDARGATHGTAARGRGARHVARGRRRWTEPRESLQVTFRGRESQTVHARRGAARRRPAAICAAGSVGTATRRAVGVARRGALAGAAFHRLRRRDGRTMH